MTWSLSVAIGTAAHPAVGVVSVSLPRIRIEALHFATDATGSTATGSTDWYYLYTEGNTHPDLPTGRKVQWWGLGAKISDPEWVRGRAEQNNRRACFTRNRPLGFRVKLTASTSVALSGTLEVTPILEGSTAYLTPASVSFTYPADMAEHWVTITTGGAMPDEVGRYVLRLRWKMTGTGFRFGGPKQSRLRIYAIFAPPLDPEYDSASSVDPGKTLTRTEGKGTLTGTKKRLDHMMLLIGGRDRRQPVATEADLVSLYWRLHCGINDTPGAPPYFDGGHDESLTANGTDTGPRIPLKDQWLAWVSSSSHWNDMSCIGHVQLAKTMLAAVGLFARRTWVFPHTTRIPPNAAAPDGATVPFSAEFFELYCLGNYDESKKQKATCYYGGFSYEAHAVLMERHKVTEAGNEYHWEEFEACMLSPENKFLPGGYTVSSGQHTKKQSWRDFQTNKGFGSARDLLRWWSSTEQGSFQRFMCWLYRSSTEFHLWDIDGKHYEAKDYRDIYSDGKHLPPP